MKDQKEDLEKCATVDEWFSNILTLGIQKSKESVNEWEVDALFDRVLGYEVNVAKLQETCLKIQQIWELQSQIGKKKVARLEGRQAVGRLVAFATGRGPVAARSAGKLGL